ncbi:MAG: hypothetical protein H0X12_13205 [Nocardioides sp.]|nr:hypothetical protein [Nocardioides sp.]
MTGLGRRQSGEVTRREPCAVGLFDTHAYDLLALAILLLDDQREAEVIVGQVLREACPRHRSADDHGDRLILADEVHRRSFISRSGQSKVLFRMVSETDSSPIVEALPTLSDQQRAVIGLCLFGEHTNSEAAQFLALPVCVVDELLRSGLHRLEVVT